MAMRDVSLGPQDRSASRVHRFEARLLTRPMGAVSSAGLMDRFSTKVIARPCFIKKVSKTSTERPS